MFSEAVFFSAGNAVMIGIGLLLILLALFKEYEPILLIPVGFGTILANMPHLGQLTHQVFGSFLYESGIRSYIFPLLLLLGLGAMLDFGYLLARPGLLLYGITCQLGILIVFSLCSLLGFDVRDAASTGITGTLNVPISILISGMFSPKLLFASFIAILLIRSLFPDILFKLISGFIPTLDWSATTDYQPRPISSRARILFPILVTIVFSMLLPGASLLIGMFMLGNLVSESNLLEHLSRHAQYDLVKIMTFLLGLAIGLNFTPDTLLTTDTLLVFGLSLVAMTLNTVAGFLYGKFLALISHGKVNPIWCLVGLIPAPISGKLISQIALQQGSGERFIEQAQAIHSGAQLINVLLGCIFIVIAA